jgi:hypothetical protein
MSGMDYANERIPLSVFLMRGPAYENLQVLVFVTSLFTGHIPYLTQLASAKSKPFLLPR